ncbi:MAG: hypothetical protein E6G15_00520 [Actinobacteria bacterium]|nr:MAG: hypothetical protein E6G15_00520 [Actinomycetota bacterium]
MAKKKFDPQAKAKRQKIFAAVGGVLLLGLLAFQVPRTLKLLHQSNATASSSQTSSATAPATTQPIAPPSLGGGNATAGTSTTTADGLSDPNGAVTPQAGQLTALGRFQSKDPFAQQMDATCGASGPACSSGGSKGGTQGGARGATGPTGTGTGTQPPVKATVAVISVNGSSETVQVGARFPLSNPTFVLVSLTAKTAKVGIANGSLAGSKQTVMLKKNVPLTLMNTADGTRYVLRLVAVS